MYLSCKAASVPLAAGWRGVAEAFFVGYEPRTQLSDQSLDFYSVTLFETSGGQVASP